MFDIFLLCIFLAFQIFLAKNIFFSDRDATHVLFFEFSEGVPFSEFSDLALLFYGLRPDYGYPLIAYISSSLLSFELFNQLYSISVFYLLLRVVKQSKITKSLSLLFVLSSPQIQAALIYALAAKTFIFLYLVSLNLGFSRLNASFLSVFGHLQGFGQISVRDLWGFLTRVKTILPLAAVFCVTWLCLLIIFPKIGLSDIINFFRGFIFFTEPNYTIAISLLAVVTIFTAMRLAFKRIKFLDFLFDLPVALFLELVFRTKRLTINIALYILLSNHKYTNVLLFLGCIYNGFAIARGGFNS